MSDRSIRLERIGVDVVVVHLDFIPDLVTSIGTMEISGPYALLESGDGRGHSYLCAGEESPRFEIAGDWPGSSESGRSIVELRNRFDDRKPSGSDRTLMRRFPSIITGGGIGFFIYDFARTLERLPESAVDDFGLPHARLFFPSTILVGDHERESSLLILRRDGRLKEKGRAALESGALELAERLRGLPRHTVPTPHSSGRADDPSVPSGYIPSMSRDEFIEIVDRAREYIREGDIFQANLSLRLSTPYSGRPTDLYAVLREMNPSPYMTLLEFDDLAIVGASPEQLLRVSGRDIATRPIAGTRRRGRTAEEEEEKERELLASEKERAEHLMLVDLERNDIGRVAAYGSVTVDEFMTLERYSHVVHIVSNVIGRLSGQFDRFDALGALFPGGTITGAPKVRAMEIIDELEPVRRGIYTGAIGWIGYGPMLELNIAIRSILLRNRSAWLQGGAGIVADSVGELEYRESLKKLAAAIAAVEEERSRRA